MGLAEGIATLFIGVIVEIVYVLMVPRIMSELLGFRADRGLTLYDGWIGFLEFTFIWVIPILIFVVTLFLAFIFGALERESFRGRVV